MSAQTALQRLHCSCSSRVTEGCNAWFFCEDDRGCYDWQTQLTVGRGFCVLMAASARPQPEPQMQDVVEPFDFFGYQAGYLKGAKARQPLRIHHDLIVWTHYDAMMSATGDLYLRPPHVLVATAVAGCNPDGGGLPSQTWQRADWLNHLSIANKQDFARLQGFRFLFTHVKARGRTVTSGPEAVHLNVHVFATHCCETTDPPACVAWRILDTVCS